MDKMGFSKVRKNPRSSKNPKVEFKKNPRSWEKTQGVVNTEHGSQRQAYNSA